MYSAPLVSLPKAEVPRLREAMRDLQLSVSSFYAETARTGEDLGRWVRGFLSTAQVLNDLLQNKSAQSATYKALFVVRTTSGVDLIDAVKYARNVDQHVFHTVEPGSDRSYVKGPRGTRTYEVWGEVPQGAHDDLRKGTQALKSYYDAATKGQDVTEAMMGVLRFYAALDPAIVHRDHRGEWTGFPLADQAAVAKPLHPEEPSGLAAAMAWLEGRRPNGDARVVCAQVTHKGVRYLCGFTFAGGLSFSPFAETGPQVERDVTAGMPYLIGDLAGNIEDVRARYGTRDGVFRSIGPVESWATPIEGLERDQDWHTGYDERNWGKVVRVEHIGATTEHPSYGIRRARRLNAYVRPARG